MIILCRFKIYFLLKFLCNVFWSCFCPSSTLSTSSSPCSLRNIIYFSLSLLLFPSFSLLKKKNKIKKQNQNYKNPHKTKNQNKQAKDQQNKRIPKQSKMKEKVHRNTIKLVLCWSTTLGHGAYLGVWLIYLVRLHWRTFIFTRPLGISFR